MDPTSSHDFLFKRFNLRGPPAFRLEIKQQKTQEKKKNPGGGVKMAEEYDGETTFSPTNSSKEQLKGEQSLQNNF